MGFGDERVIFVSTPMSTLTRTVSVLLEGKPVLEGPRRKVDIEEVDDPEDPDA